jgi:integrase
MAEWIGTKFKGVRYRQHSDRKHGVKWDRYFSIRYQADGKRIEEGLGWASEGWTEEKAALKLAELKTAARTGEGPTRLAEKRQIEDKRKKAEREAQEQAEKENITFGTFMTETYLPQSKHDKKERTYKIEEMLYRLHLADTIGGLPFGKISAFQLERIKKDMADKGLSDRTIQYCLQVTRHVFHTARKLGVYAGESPTNAVKWPKLDNMKLRYLSIDEAERLLAALAAKSQSLHDIALLSLHCGLRFGEIAALTWSCVNWTAGTLAILDAKTGSRTAYLTEKAKAMLQAREQGRPDELIFPKRSGKAGTMAQASKVYNETVKELGFNESIVDRKMKVDFHTLRHTFATHLYENTSDLYLTQRSLGHTTPTMTQRYAKMSENRLREGAAALERAFEANGKEGQGGQVVNFEK